MRVTVILLLVALVATVQAGWFFGSSANEESHDIEKREASGEVKVLDDGTGGSSEEGSGDYDDDDDYDYEEEDDDDDDDDEEEEDEELED
ncbi:calsequestrin-1-like [Penaeus indicus]|uniref:calsequestrin-1-like n=1 Tax=Penaeus indicus TaxID=29960 RepID=UPI00300C43E3